MSGGMQRAKGRGRALMSKRSQIEVWVRKLRQQGKWFPTALEISGKFEVGEGYAKKLLADFKEEMR